MASSKLIVDALTDDVGVVNYGYSSGLPGLPWAGGSLTPATLGGVTVQAVYFNGLWIQAIYVFVSKTTPLVGNILFVRDNLGRVIARIPKPTPVDAGEYLSYEFPVASNLFGTGGATRYLEIL